MWDNFNWKKKTPLLKVESGRSFGFESVTEKSHVKNSKRVYNYVRALAIPPHARARPQMPQEPGPRVSSSSGVRGPVACLETRASTSRCTETRRRRVPAALSCSSSRTRPR